MQLTGTNWKYASGLPQGYITHLEHRLIDTELALYTLYTQLRTAGLHTDIPDPRIPASVPDTLARQSRTTNMAEWEKFPLRDARDWERWWIERRVLLGGEESTSSPHVLGGEASSVAGSREGGSGAGAEEGREMESNAGGSPAAIRRGQKAEKLARAEANVYF